MITCPACRNPVDVPEDYDDESIRCGICWAEVVVGRRAKSEPIVELAVPEPVAVAKVDPFAGIPGRPARGMAPLENLLRNVAERVPGLFQPVPAPPPAPVVLEPRPATPQLVERRKEEDGLRRKRGMTSSRTMFKDEPEPPPRKTSMPFVLVMVLFIIFGVAFVVFRQFFRGPQ